MTTFLPYPDHSDRAWSRIGPWHSSCYFILCYFNFCLYHNCIFMFKNGPIVIMNPVPPAAVDFFSCLIPVTWWIRDPEDSRKKNHLSTNAPDGQHNNVTDIRGIFWGIYTQRVEALRQSYWDLNPNSNESMYFLSFTRWECSIQHKIRLPSRFVRCYSRS